MKKITYECLRCENKFSLSWKTKQTPVFCCFCGDEIVLEDEPFIDDDLDEEEDEAF